MIRNLIAALFILISPAVYAGEVSPLSAGDKEITVGKLKYACDSEDSTHNMLDNWRALGGPSGAEGCWDLRNFTYFNVVATPVHRYHDDEGDLTIVYSITLDGRPYFTANMIRGTDA